MQNAFTHFFCVLVGRAAFFKAGKISPHALGHGKWRFSNCLMAMGFGLMLILTMVAQSTMAQTVTATITAGAAPRAVAINPVTNKIYVANQNSNNVTVVDAAPSTFANHHISVAMTGGTVTSLTAPTLSLTVSGAYAPNDPAVRTVYYRQNDAQGPYTAVTGSGPFTATLAGLQLGENIVSYACAVWP